jgi:hemerythrin-like domain-containing protein
MAKSSQGIVSSIRALLPFGDSEKQSATVMLRAEHRMVDALFEEFMATESNARRRDIATKVVSALRAHTTIEEEIFYPALRRKLEDEEPIECAYEEHGIAKRLLDELDGMKASDAGFSAKFKVLAESVRHHVREEESEILPQAESSELDLEALGEEMRERQRELRSGGRAKRSGSRRSSRARRATASGGRPKAARGGTKTRGRTAASGAKKRAGAKKASSRGKKAASGSARARAKGRRARRAS